MATLTSCVITIYIMCSYTVIPALQSIKPCIWCSPNFATWYYNLPVSVRVIYVDRNNAYFSRNFYGFNRYVYRYLWLESSWYLIEIILRGINFSYLVFSETLLKCKEYKFVFCFNSLDYLFCVSMKCFFLDTKLLDGIFPKHIKCKSKELRIV